MKPDADDSGETDERYGSFTTGGGDVVVYDRENAEAWIQSSYTVSVGPSSERRRA